MVGKTGVALTPEIIEALAAEAEEGYDLSDAVVVPVTEASTCLLCLHTVRWLCCAHSQCPECQGPLEGWTCGMCQADIREADAYLAQPVDAVLPAVVDWDNIPW